jgi:hypothetical protein
MAGKTVGSVPLAAANLGGLPRVELESLRVLLKAPKAAVMSPRARGLRHILEASLLATESALGAESKLIEGDLTEIRFKDMPELLGAQFKCVRGLQKFGVELNKPGGQANLKEMTEALQDVHRANPKLAARVRDSAAARAERKGQAELAEKLRNIELVLGPGAGEPGPFHLDLPPPSAHGTSQAGQQESVLKGLEGHIDPEAYAEAQAVERKLNHNLGSWADFRYTLGQSYYQLARLASKPDDPREEAAHRQKRKQCLLRAESILRRKLRPSERLLVADMVAQGYKDEQIDAELRDLEREEVRP